MKLSCKRKMAVVLTVLLCVMMLQPIMAQAAVFYNSLMARYEFVGESPENVHPPVDSTRYGSEEEAARSTVGEEWALVDENCYVSGVKDGLQGTWEFLGWQDPVSDIIEGDSDTGDQDGSQLIGVVFRGTWQFIPNDTQMPPLNPPSPDGQQICITFRIINGTWDGQDASDKVYYISSGDTLQENMIPYDMQPDDGYDPNGSWDHYPMTWYQIYEDMTFTYSFDLPPTMHVRYVWVGEHPDIDPPVDNREYQFDEDEDAIACIVGNDWAANPTNIRIDDVVNGVSGYWEFEGWSEQLFDFEAEDADPWLDIPPLQKFVGYYFEGSWKFNSGSAPTTDIINVTFRIVGGTWDGNQTADWSIPLLKGAVLRNSYIPKDMQPLLGYTDQGSWDVQPDTVTPLETDTTFTYTFRKEMQQTNYTVTFKVENGTWDGQDKADKTVSVQKNSKLKASDVPTGMHADTGFENGHWEVEPDTATGVTENLTYTYKFDPMPNYTVIFKVENGTWDGQDKADKTVSVQKNSKLKASDVPTGMQANVGFENGHWEVEPDTTNGVTENTIYIYTFDATQQQANEADVLFRIINGTWDGVDKADKYAVITLTSVDPSSAVNDVTFPVGMIPDQGYTNEGNWVNTISTDTNGRLQILSIYTFKTESAKPQNPSNPTDPSKPGEDTNKEESSKPTSPKTGDNSNMLLWLALMVASCGGIVAIGAVRKKRERSK